MAEWLELLKQAVKKRGLGLVERELGVSKTTVSLVLSGKYGASTDNIQALVEGIYDPAGVFCRAWERRIDPGQCADLRDRANKIGLKAGNPDSLRAYLACGKCSLNRG
ncbi:MAG: helix-turn-helix transcriptional regulator [Deltaproteobacteria bacterium]|nr:helix-turn-helix transcriptional regulator [Deltaproteobacteria bacterium]